jgi:NAD-dependent deacetylase
MDRLRALMRASRSTVVLTGAGISTESGIPDYRSSAGIWRGIDPTKVAHIDAFRADPAYVWTFYRRRIDMVRQARPNAGHLALAELERDGRIERVVTQNVDGLHRAAGSDPIEVHGSLDDANCVECGVEMPMAEAEARMATDPEQVPRCDCGAPLKPAVVLFGEPLPEEAIGAAYDLAEQCTLLIAAGSSLEVHPVAGLPGVARRRGARVAIVNFGETAYDDACDLRIEGRLAELLPQLL